jgi:hypothetical protein
MADGGAIQTDAPSHPFLEGPVLVVALPVAEPLIGRRLRFRTRQFVCARVVCVISIIYLNASSQLKVETCLTG